MLNATFIGLFSLAQLMSLLSSSPKILMSCLISELNNSNDF